jgi:hypothetical protein
MSSIIWTQNALSAERLALKADCWRVVEAQHRASAMKLTHAAEDQAILEDIIEATKPRNSDECAGLDFLLFTPFRFDAPYPTGSRLRRAGFTQGVFYGSEAPLTANAETAFHRLLFFAESPGTPFPANASEYTAFCVPLATEVAHDLTEPSLNSHSDLWRKLDDYSDCQDLGDAARAAGIAVFLYESVRDPDGGRNFAVLDCKVFTSRAPTA